MKEANFSTSGIAGKLFADFFQSILGSQGRLKDNAIGFTNRRDQVMSKPRRLRPSRLSPCSLARSPVALQYGGTSLETIEPAPKIAPVPMRTN